MVGHNADERRWKAELRVQCQMGPSLEGRASLHYTLTCIPELRSNALMLVFDEMCHI